MFYKNHSHIPYQQENLIICGKCGLLMKGNPSEYQGTKVGMISFDGQQFVGRVPSMSL